MKWVKNWFENKCFGWKQVAMKMDDEKKLGHSIYAWKQMALWKGFAKRAEEAFQKIDG